MRAVRPRSTATCLSNNLPNPRFTMKQFKYTIDGKELLISFSERSGAPAAVTLDGAPVAPTAQEMPVVAGVIALALHNKDAVLLGYGGSTAGDVCFWVAEGYNYDHTDSLSTTYGEGDTSSSPIFVAAGPGFKTSYTTDRIIRQVDMAPTICWLFGVRMPAQCEGAIIYQILEEEV